MKLTKIFKKFAANETGAVTVDWVVLTAGIVGLGIIVMTKVGGGATTVSTKIATSLGTTAVGYTP
jgi:Flp pilus assembly pilin Flp